MVSTPAGVVACVLPDGSFRTHLAAAGPSLGATVTHAHDLARWRLRRQHLTAPHAASASDVVRGLLAVQAENRDQAAWAVASRTARPDGADLVALLDSGQVIRTHVLRPTWHFVAADDAGWLLELTAPRVRTVVHRQLTGALGWRVQEVDRATACVLDRLAASPDQTREQLGQALDDGGVPATGQQLMLLLAVMELDRIVCSGCWVAGTHTYALYAERVRPGPRLNRDEALAELAWRYFSGHGPATERDLAYWATLTLADVRRGLDLSRDRLASFEHDGRTFWHAPEAADPGRPPEPAGHLLQILDEVYRGYQDTRMVIDAAGLVARGREPAAGMALIDGQMAGWMRRTVGARVRFDVTPLRPLGPADLDALEAAAARYGAFLGLEHELQH